MNFKPIHDRVLLKVLKEDDKTSGGIIIPDATKEKSSNAEVVAVGTGVKDEHGNIVPLSVKEGDIVLFSKFSGMETTIEKEKYLIVKELDILGIVGSK